MSSMASTVSTSSKALQLLEPELFKHVVDRRAPGVRSREYLRHRPLAAAPLQSSNSSQSTPSTVFSANIVINSANHFISLLERHIDKPAKSAQAPRLLRDITVHPAASR